MTTTESGQPEMLPALVAPHYFSGQLLTDRDLDVLVEWTRARLELGAERDGFGVVSGLGFRLDPRNGHEADVIIGPGYAVGPFGDDIVVPADTPLSLSDVQLTSDDETHPVDVFIEPSRVNERPQPGFEDGSDDDEEASARYSRVREKFALQAEAAADEDPDQVAAASFEAGYEACLEPLHEYRRWRRAGTRGPDQIRQWLRSRLLATEFRFAALELDDCSAEELREEHTAVRALFWLIQHRRNEYIAASRPTPNRVRLARVWVRDAAHSVPRTVVAVDVHPPFRRRLGKPTLPAASGSVNGCLAIWEQEATAELLLAQHGILPGTREEFELPSTLERLEAALAGRMFLRPGDRAVLQLFHHRPLGRRVVGLAAGPIGVEIEKRGPETASAGEEVEYTVTVANHGDEGVEVELRDPERIDERFLEPHEETRFKFTREIPEEAAVRHENVATVSGRARDGRRFKRRASWTTVIGDDQQTRPGPVTLGTGVITEGPSEGTRFDLVEGQEAVIGREGARVELDEEEGLDLRLDELGRHAVLIPEAGRVVLENKSPFGTHVNGHRVYGRHTLDDGDTIEVGRTEVRIDLRRR